MHVFWFDRVYFVRLYISTALFEFLESVTRTTILAASTFSTTPLFFETTQTPESPATIVSNPVPTNGFSGFNTGTAWRIMFDPIKALLASSCSRKGINEAATETTC